MGHGHTFKVELVNTAASKNSGVSPWQ